MNKKIFGENSVFTVRGILKILALVCSVLVFFPMFLVSCSNREIVEINAWGAVKGYEYYGEQIVDPHPFLLLLFILPAAILALLFVKKMKEKNNALFVGACALADSIIWFLFRYGVGKFAAEGYCSYKTTGWYVVNIISLFLIVGITVPVVLGKLRMDTDLKKMVQSDRAKEKLDMVSEIAGQVTGTVSKIAKDVAKEVAKEIRHSDEKAGCIGYCAKCGSAIPYGVRFCGTCGTEVPESLLAEAEEARKKAEETHRH